jgi:mRNA interferase MazF
MKIYQGDIVWVSFPFTDGRTFKERPALVLSNNQYNESSLDILLCYITSQHSGRYLIDILIQDLKQGKLQKQSFLKYDKILLVERTRVMGVIAVVKKSFYRKAARAICNFIQSQ